MTGRSCAREFRSLSRWAIPLLTLALIFSGCQAKEPPLSPAAASFKTEVKECINRLATPLLEPVSQRDLAAINETLKKTEPEAIKLCRMCPFRIAVLDKTGNTMTVYPFKRDAVADFSNYELVVETLKNRVIGQKRLFLQDGSQVYIICAPLRRGEEMLGILAISLSATEAKNRWGITEPEFLGIDFNR